MIKKEGVSPGHPSNEAAPASAFVGLLAGAVPCRVPLHPVEGAPSRNLSYRHSSINRAALAMRAARRAMAALP